MKELTPRQKEILDLYLSGLTYREVCEQAGIALGTFGPHLRKIARKLGTTHIAREALAELVAG